MRKVTAFILAFVLAAAAGVVSADSPVPDFPLESFEIPRAPDGFSIGDLDDEAKWTGALHRTLTPANIQPVMGAQLDNWEDSEFWFLWSEAGVYFRAVHRNRFHASVSAPPFRTESSGYNRGNSVQFFPSLYNSNDLPGWTFHPYTMPDGVADVWLHWPERGFDGGFYDGDARIYAGVHDWGYILEGLMPAQAWSEGNGASIGMAAGTGFSMFIVLLQAPEEGVHHGFSDAGWFGGSDGSHSYTLSAAVAPGAPAEPEPEPAAAAAEPAPEVVAEAPAADDVAPETSDSIIIILAFAAAAAALAFKTAKKAG